MIKLRKIVSFCLVLFLCINMFFPISLSATDSEDSTALYSVEVHNEDEWYTNVYNALISGHPNLRVKYYGKFTSIYDSGLAPRVWDLEKMDKYDSSDTSSDSDYLYEHISSIITKDYIYYSDYTEYSLYVVLRESTSQTKLVDEMVSYVIKCFGQDFNNLTDYKKVEMVHDWIVTHISYDYSLTNTTAYTALYNNQTICSGYSMLFYKFMTELNIDCKIVRGFINDAYHTNAYHAWNIVRLNNVWYNVDTTWDVGNMRGYFLKTMSSMTEHTYELLYTYDWFEQKYILSNSDFIVNSYSYENPSIQFEKELYSLNIGNKVEVKYNFQDMSEYSKLKFISMDKSIVTVDKDGYITGVKTGNTTIKAYTNDEKITQAFEVQVTNPITKILGSTKTKTLSVGDKLLLSFNAYPSNADNITLTYKASNENVKISNKGMLTATKKGTSIITIQSLSNPDINIRLKIVIK